VCRSSGASTYKTNHKYQALHSFNFSCQEITGRSKTPPQYCKNGVEIFEPLQASTRTFSGSTWPRSYDPTTVLCVCHAHRASGRSRPCIHNNYLTYCIPVISSMKGSDSKVSYSLPLLKSAKGFANLSTYLYFPLARNDPSARIPLNGAYLMSKK
jgi:hypothetical protein